MARVHVMALCAAASALRPTARRTALRIGTASIIQIALPALADTEIDMDKILQQKKEICSFVFTQPKGQRVSFFETINSYKQVCSAGRLFNNTNWTIKGRGDQRWKID